MATADSNHCLSFVVDSLLKQAVEDDRFLGVSFVAVDKHGRTLYSGAHGRQSFESSEKMAVHTAGWLASMTKLMTAIAAMQLVERGLVRLDDDLSTLVPELCDPVVLIGVESDGQRVHTEPAARPITLRHLLSHSSGCAYDEWDETLGAWAQATGKTKELCRADIKAYVRPLLFSPGEGWVYGPGLDWVGRVVEVVSGLSLEEYMQTHIWTPLGMINTTFRPKRRERYPMLQLGLRTKGPDQSLQSGEGWFQGASWDMGGGGAFGSASDYAKLLAALFLDNGPLLNKASIDELFKPQLSGSALKGLNKYRTLGAVQIDIPLDIPVNHSLGGLVVCDSVPQRRSLGSMNWDGMYNGQWMIDRKMGFACTMLTQIFPCPDLAAKQLWAQLERAVYASIN